METTAREYLQSILSSLSVLQSLTDKELEDFRMSLREADHILSDLREEIGQ